MSTPQVHIYTDGAAKGNPGPGGYGVILEWVGKPYRKELSAGFRHTTNNRMELLAVIVGLEQLKNPNTSVLVVSDSKYVVDAVAKNWVLGWEKKGFAGKKNPDLWKRFLLIYRQHHVTFQWIKGHNNHPQNERCDALAVAASMQKDLFVDTEYEKGGVEWVLGYLFSVFSLEDWKISLEETIWNLEFQKLEFNNSCILAQNLPTSHSQLPAIIHYQFILFNLQRKPIFAPLIWDC